MNYEEKVRSLKLVLPPAAKPVGSYQPMIISGTIAYLSGQISKSAEGKITTGKVGRDLSLEQGIEAARLAALGVVSIIQNILGFEKFEKMIRIVGYVQVAPDFYDISRVVNGASDLLIELFGEKGKHARSAVGMASLPLNAAVEVEATIGIR